MKGKAPTQKCWQETIIDAGKYNEKALGLKSKNKAQSGSLSTLSRHYGCVIY